MIGGVQPVGVCWDRLSELNRAHFIFMTVACSSGSLRPGFPCWCCSSEQSRGGRISLPAVCLRARLSPLAVGGVFPYFGTLMTGDELSEIEEVRHAAARLGIVLPSARVPAPTIGCFGYRLPTPFVWLCRHYPRHSGFPHRGWTPPMGLLSPLGRPSDLKRRNEQIRGSEPDFPAHWIGFWHGNDGDFCFSYDPDGHAWVVYYDYNVTMGRQAIGWEHLPFRDDYEWVNFAECFAGQVDWALEQDRFNDRARG